jgi:hypothetical protein
MAGTRNKTQASNEKGGAKSSPDPYDNLDDLFEPDEELWEALIMAQIPQLDGMTGLRAGFVTLQLGIHECMKAYFKPHSGKQRSRRRSS